MADLSPSVPPVRYAGFWLRFVAFIIDLILIGIVAQIILHFLPKDAHPSGMLDFTPSSFSNVSYWVQTGLSWAYFASMECSAKQGTLGKMALGLIVTDLQGNRVTFLRALARNVAKIPSGIIFGIGFIMAAFTAKKQALHDMIASTLVVHKH